LFYLIFSKAYFFGSAKLNERDMVTIIMQKVVNKCVNKYLTLFAVYIRFCVKGIQLNLMTFSDKFLVGREWINRNHYNGNYSTKFRTLLSLFQGQPPTKYICQKKEFGLLRNI